MTFPGGDDKDSLLREAVLIGRDFYKHSGPPPGSPPVPIDFVIDMSRSYASRGKPDQLQIHVKGVPNPKNHFYSTLVSIPGGHRATILVHHSLNLCYTRFAIATELAGLLLGTQSPAMRTTDIIQHLRGLRAGLVPDRHTALWAEELAKLVAIEFLVPMAHRERMENLIHGNASALKIATEFRIPESVVDDFLTGGWEERIHLHESIKDVDPIPPGTKSEWD